MDYIKIIAQNDEKCSLLKSPNCILIPNSYNYEK